MVLGLREIYATREDEERANSATSELSGLVDDVVAFVHAGMRELGG
jgi:hypothetical protein